VPGSGAQVHDFNGGILASGLFWTLPIPDDALWVSDSGRRAVLEVENLSVLDSFSFGGQNVTPASVSFRIEWRATGPFVRRGSEKPALPTDPDAFVGDIATARSTGFFEGSEFGFAFEAHGDTDPQAYAQMGRERNGVFLS